MADDDLVTIAKYGSPQDANLAKGVLGCQGIRACVIDEATHVWLSYIGPALGGVRLQVAKRDVEKANDALRSLQSQEGSSDPRWSICPHCGAEVDAGFDVCWSCETPMDEHSATVESAKPNAADRRTVGSVDVAIVGDEVFSLADANATRAFRAAIFGIVFPPLLLYAIYLVIKTMGQELSPTAARKLYAALAICLVFLTVWIVGWQYFFRL